MELPVEIRAAARTHPGRVRSRNEDAMLDHAAIGLWAVADGMGGHSRGEWASALVVDGLGRLPQPQSAQSFVRDVRTSIQASHAEIRATAEANGGDGVIGCTIVTLMVFGHHFACLWAGDSRLYRFNQAGLKLISHDHSRVQELVDAELLSEAEAMAHPQANVITRAVGFGELDLDMRTAALEPGDVLLLCSDGLTRELPDAQMETLLGADGTLDELCERLVQAANKAGGHDNITCVLVRAA